MELYEREYFVARILSGYLRHRVDKNLVIKIYSPNVDQVYESEEIYLEEMKTGRKHDLLTEKEMEEWQFKLGTWTTEDETLFEQLPKDLESFKEQLYNNRYKFSQTEQLRKYIQKAKSEYLRLGSKKYAHQTATCEGYAMYCKWNWLIEQCTFFLDGTPYDWKKVSSYDLLSSYKGYAIQENEYRELARNNPWRSYWNLSGKTIQGVFGVCASEASTEQRTIASFAKMYDNVYESTECPEEDVIEDDDMLDGWFVVQTKKREADKKKSQTESVGHGNAQDVFIMADGKEDIDRINSMNDTRAKVVSKQRHRIAEEQGKVKHQDLPDVRRDINMQANQMQSSKKG
jgi:hypothetical protein|tara:strand:- start:115 stop:1146 length:1032 start_codon:yes stop_codon:yes gene_type:complete